MDKLAQKEESARQFLRLTLERFRNPVIYFSGGKDSIVMLHLITWLAGVKLPVVFHREPFLHAKYEFGMKVLADWGFTAHDYPPLKVSLWLGKSILAYTNHYQIGVTRDKKPTTLDLPKNLITPLSNDCLCGLQDIIRRPTGFFNYPWDLAFIGHKDCDSDQIAGDTHLYADVVQNQGGPSLAFPLRDWTHDDVWNYIEANNLPVQEDRYDRLARTELKDKRVNGDYFEACTACIDKRNDAFVRCPRLNGALVNNVSDQIEYKDLPLPYYGEKTNV